MRLRYLLLVLLAGVCFLNGCGTDESTVYSDSILLSKVTILHKGYTVLYPTTTTVTITPDAIEYVQVNSKDGIVGQWSEAISFSDYLLVQHIINQYRLYSADNVTSESFCTGNAGMTVTIESYTGTPPHSFNIPGNAMCDRAAWPKGVQALINLEENLIAKYE